MPNVPVVGPGGGGLNPVVAAIVQAARATGVPIPLALAIAFHESGLNPDNVGDGGTSFGLFQLHRGGELPSGWQPGQAFDPYQNALVALTEVARVMRSNPGMSWGEIAARAQRPANAGAYASAINGLVMQHTAADPLTVAQMYSHAVDTGQTSLLAPANAGFISPASMPQLEQGSNGEAVRTLQQRLGIQADGIFGPLTQTAVEHYQTEHGLAVDGIVGPQTWGALGFGGTDPGSPAAATLTSAAGGPGGGGGLAQQILDYGMSFQGTPYVWGGESAKGFDCSGLVQFVYGRMGVKLPRVASAQANAGQHISAAQARPGDLVWFENNSSEPGADHIGIYMGGGLMLEAPHTGANVEIAPVGNATGFTRVLPQGAWAGMPQVGGQLHYSAGAAGSATNVTQYIEQNYGYMAPFLNDPEIGPFLREAAQNGWDATTMQAKLQSTNWWQRTSQTARTWQALQATDPATAAQQMSQSEAQIKAMAQTLGVTLGPADVQHIAFSQNMFGWSSLQVQQAIAAQFRFNANKQFGGQAGSTIEQLQAMANAYLVPMSNATLRQWTQQSLANPSLSPDSFKSYIEGMAKSRFADNPTILNAIKNGQTVRDFLAPYSQTAAQTLDISPDAINWMDPKWMRTTDQIDPESGKRAPMNLGDFQTELMSNPVFGFDTTQNARTQATQLSQQIAARMGAI